MHKELTNGKEESQWFFGLLLKGLMGQHDSLCPLDSSCSLRWTCLHEVWSIARITEGWYLCGGMCARSSHGWSLPAPWNIRMNHPILSGWIPGDPGVSCYITVAYKRNLPRHMIKSTIQGNKSGKGSPLILEDERISAVATQENHLGSFEKLRIQVFHL